MTVVFELDGQEFIALNGGPQFKFTEAISFSVACKTQKEVDEGRDVEWPRSWEIEKGHGSDPRAGGNGAWRRGRGRHCMKRATLAPR